MNSQDNPIFVSHLTKWDVFKCSSLVAFFNLFFPNFHKLRLIHCFSYIVYWVSYIICLLIFTFYPIFRFNLYILLILLSPCLISLFLGLIYAKLLPSNIAIPLNYPIQNRSNLDDSFKKIKIWKIALKKEKYNFIISTKKFLILSGPIKIKQNYKVKYYFVLFIISKKQNQKLLSHYDLYNNQIIKSKHYINLSNQ